MWLTYFSIYYGSDIQSRWYGQTLANIGQHYDTSGARIGPEQGPSSLKIWISDDEGEVNARDFIEKQNGEAVLPAIILKT